MISLMLAIYLHLTPVPFRLYTAIYVASARQNHLVRGQCKLHDRKSTMLNGIQRRAAHGISGGFKAVAGEAYNAELHLQPIDCRLRNSRMQTLTRLATSPAFHRSIRSRRVFYPKPEIQTALEAAKEELPRRADAEVTDMKMR